MSIPMITAAVRPARRSGGRYRVPPLPVVAAAVASGLTWAWLLVTTSAPVGWPMVIQGLHLTAGAGVLVALVSQVLSLQDGLLRARVGLDALSTTLGLTAVAATAGIETDLPTVAMVLASLYIGLGALAVALSAVLRPARDSALAATLPAAGLVLAAHLYSSADDTPSDTSVGITVVLTTAACATVLIAVTRLVQAPGVSQPRTADRLAMAANVLPFAGTGAALLAVHLAAQSLNVVPMDSVLVAAVACLGVVAVRFLLTLRFARSALQRLEDSHTDTLTGLLNRHGLADRLDRWLTTGQPVTLLALDLADFRRINEEAGHETGDRVLHRVAAQLAALGSADTVVARIDGDDFAMAFPGLDSARASVLTADVRAAVSRPFDLDHHRLHLSVNVGTTTTHPLPGDVPSSTGTLLRCADQALASAQSASTGTAVHDPADCGLVHADRPLAWVDQLHAALAVDDQLLLHFQPQHRIDPDGTAHEVVGCEALLRWSHPTRGLLGPAEALRAAAHGQLAGALAERVLDLALTAVASWWAQHPVPVAVNLSAADLDDGELPHRIQAALDRQGVPAAALAVEVVEDTLMLDPDRAVATLTALHDIGLRIAVDDYGTGYSSLAYLHRLPVDEVKFDRSLTAGISTDPAAATIIGHSIALAHDLGLDALAEGVEEAADLQLLSTLGCDTVQGWLISRPAPVAEWLAHLERHAADHARTI